MTGNEKIMTCILRCICQLSWEMNFYDRIINLEKWELSMKRMLRIKFVILGASSYNKDTLVFPFCVCDCVLIYLSFKKK